MPAVYDKMGIRFQYPENWTLEEEDALSGSGAVSVYSPGGAFWSIAIHPRFESPQRLIDAALKAMREEYEGLESEEVQEEVAGHEMLGYDLHFICLDLTNTSRIRCCHTDDATYLLFCQAEDREFESIEAVFQAMTVSLLT